MSTPCTTMNRLIRWRMRDLVSCFMACSISVNHDPDTCRVSSRRVPIRNRVFEVRNGDRGRKSDRRLTRRNRGGGKERRVGGGTQDSSQTRRTGSSESKSNESSPSYFHEEEDYIVFYFKQDGDLGDDKPDAAAENSCSPGRTSQPRPGPRPPVSRKLIYGEVGETSRESSHEKKENSHEQAICLSNEEGGDIFPLEEFLQEEEEESCCLDAEKPSSDRRMTFPHDEAKGSTVVPLESSGSRRSNDSRQSFSFPILSWEPIGSPVHMPKPEDLRMRHRLHFPEHKN